MRPDPYKQKRSRQYQARQRAEGKAVHETPGTSVTPQNNAAHESLGPHAHETPRGRALPSNAARYEEEEAAPEALFDYGTAEELAAALDALRGQPVSVPSAQETRAREQSGHLLLTDAEVQAIDAALSNQEPCALELEGLPDFGFSLLATDTSPESAPKTPDAENDAVVASVKALRIAVSDASAQKSATLSKAPRDADEAWLDSVL